MRQAVVPYTEVYDEDTPMEGKKSCTAEAYKEEMYTLSKGITVESDQKLLN